MYASSSVPSGDAVSNPLWQSRVRWAESLVHLEGVLLAQDSRANVVDLIRRQGETYDIQSHSASLAWL